MNDLDETPSPAAVPTPTPEPTPAPAPTPTPTPELNANRNQEILTSEIADQLIMLQGTDIVIPDGVTSIASGAFAYNQLTSVVIPKSVTSIGVYAFRDNQLKNIEIPNSVTSIEDGAFSYNQLSNLVIPNSVTSIGNSAFSNNQLSSAVIPNSVTSIGDWAFYSNKLTNVVIPDSVTSVEYSAFNDNPLETISVSADSIFDLSAFPADIEIIVRDGNENPATPIPTPTPEPIPAPVPTEEGGVKQIEFIGDIATSDEVSTFKLTKPIPFGGQNVEILIVGTEKKDKITGSSQGEILAGGEGKDVLKGRGGPDGFLFQDPDGFGNKEADKVKDFDPGEGDSVLLDQDVFDLGKKIKLKTATGKKAAKTATDSNEDFIYDNKKGLLYYNENGKEEGWGDGGLFVKLKGAPELGVEDFTIL